MPVARKTNYKLTLSGLFIGLLGWQALSFQYPMFIPAPKELLQAVSVEVRSGQLLFNVKSSLSHVFYGVLFGAIIGLFLGTICAINLKILDFLSGIIAALRPIPPLAWIPLILGISGVNSTSAAIVVGIGTVWTIYVSTLAGLQSVPYEYVELAKVYGRKNISNILFDVMYRAAAPTILGGMRTAIGQALTLVVAAELFGVPGIGQRMWEASGLLNMEVVLVYMLVLSLGYILFDFVFEKFERRVFRWRRSQF